MTRYISMLSFAARGIEEVAKSPQRAADFRQAVEKFGGQVVAQYWCMGSCDGVVIFEAPDEVTATSLLLKLDQLGNVKTQTLRAYDEAEFQAILQR
jgi:uncharacterized protein with GYD domain